MIGNDPVEFVHQYESPVDKEIIGFFASQFAYGKIEVMKRFLRDLFTRMGASPSGFVAAGDWSSLADLYYRFQKSHDIERLFTTLRKILDEHGSVGAMFQALYEGDTREAIWRMRERFLRNDRELIFFFPKRLPASPMKRWNLYMRWMVRSDGIDQGLWTFMDTKDLIVPLDTHLFKIGRCLGWTERKSPSWNAAIEVTAALREACPEDPLRYDFLLCHKVGIGAGCTGRRGVQCAGKCMLME